MVAKLRCVHAVLRLLFYDRAFIQEMAKSVALLQPKAQNLDLKCNICLSQFAVQVFYRLLDVLYASWAVKFIFTHQVTGYNPLT